jgi:DNA polymerase III subunit alpha
MTNLIEYLKENKISHRQIDDIYIEISGDKHMLVLPDDGILFDDEFDLIANSTEKDAKYVFYFGERWYWSNTQLKPQLNELKYLGKSQSTVPTEVFLGVHGGYELLNGSRLYKDWIKKAKFIGIHTLGLIEKNTLAGTLKFQLECLKNDIKPIIGATYTVFRECDDYRYDIKCYVQSAKGWESLLLMNKEVNVLNKKFIRESRLLELTDGIILVLDPKTIDYDKILPLDINIPTLYYQLDTVEFEEEQRDMWYLQNLKKFFNSKIKPVSIRDAYYLDKEHSHIKSKLNLVSGVFDYKADNQYFKDNEDYFSELCELFGEDDDRLFKVFKSAIRNEQYIAKICNFTIDTSKKHLPKYEMTREEKEKFESNEDLFWHLIEKGLKVKSPKTKLSEYIERAEREFDVIKLVKSESGASGIDYFLILWDIIDWCKKNNVLLGHSRGSSAGSLVAYLLDITQIDPIRWGLFFERFLTVGRIKGGSLPDIDIDVQPSKKEDVKGYMRQKYGADYFCYIGTYTTLQLKAAFKDLTRQDNADYSEVNYVTTVLDLDKATPLELFQNASKKKRIKNLIQDNFEAVNDISLILGQPKSTSIHPCATIILPKESDIFHSIPVKMVHKDDESFLVSEWDGKELEIWGALKEDILVINQLDKYSDILQSIKENEDIDIDIYSLPLDDKSVFYFFKNGYCQDIFQFGTPMFINYLKELMPESIDELIHAVALIRPGAMDVNSHNEYLFRKFGKREVVYKFGTENITKDTRGILCFQEQIMALCQELGGFSMEEADNVRSAVGKKNLVLMAEQKQKFLDGAIKNGCPENEANDIWHDIEVHGNYSFNLSHSVGYTNVSYVGMYFKVHYPIHFWTVAFKYAKEGDVPNYIAEINETGSIKVLPPDINKSDTSTKTDFKNNAIYWALSAIKQVGETATDQIMKDRQENGEYFSFGDFIDRHSYKGSKVNKRTIENMILSGCFDFLENIEHPKSRISLITEYREKVKQKIDNEKDMFENNGKLSYSWWWNLQQKRLSGIAFFNYEELVDSYAKTLNDYSYIDPVGFNKESSSENKIGKTVSGYILEFEERESKKGKFAKLKTENNYQFINILIWPDQYEQFETFLQECTKKLIIINGTVNYDNYRKTNVLQSNEETEIILLS